LLFREIMMAGRFRYVIGISIISVLWATMAVVGIHAIQEAVQTTFSVSNTNDSGPGSLRQAILDANINPGEDVISITVLGQLDLQSALPTITEAVIIYVPNAATIFRPFKIDGQNLYRGLTIANVPVTITGLTVQNAVAFGTLTGGGINSEGSLTLNGVTVLNSSAGSGGGVGSTGAIVVNGSLFQGNRASDRGGAIYAEGALTVNESIIQNNQCPTWFNCAGGGLYAGNTLTVANTEIISNTTGGAGGGLDANGAVVITGTLFSGNSASSGIASGIGGGASIFGSVSVQVTNSQFKNNNADDYGGGMYVSTAVTITLNNVDFVGNTASFHGGGLYAEAGEGLTIHGGRFEQNTASSNGGGLYGDSVVVVTDTRFISNTANVGGGARVRDIVAIGGSFEYNANSGLVALGNMVLTGTEFLNNSGASPAVYAYRTQATNVLFANNDHTALESTDPTQEATITDSQFVNNGRGIVVQGPLTVRKSLFMNNTLGGVVQSGGGDVSIVNTLIAGNTASENGAAVSLQDSGTATLKHVTIASSELVNSPAISTTKEVLLIQNTIVANHATGLNVTTGFVALSHALFHDNGLDIQGSVALDENRVTGDPLFVNPAADNFLLQSGSAAIDAGVDAGIAVDFEGEIRPSLNGFDVGYDEFVPLQVMLPIIMR
jgi:predicted outer membrane repeat protein